MKELHPNIKITDNEADMSLDSIESFFNDIKFNFKINKQDKLIKQIDLSKPKLNQPLQLF